MIVVILSIVFKKSKGAVRFKEEIYMKSDTGKYVTTHIRGKCIIYSFPSPQGLSNAIKLRKKELFTLFPARWL